MSDVCESRDSFFSCHARVIGALEPAQSQNEIEALFENCSVILFNIYRFSDIDFMVGMRARCLGVPVCSVHL